MKKQNIIMTSSSDNLPIELTIFTPDKDIKGIFQISHGMFGHRKRYYDFMKYLTKNGYVTVINDHRGHGKSIRDDEDLGYFYDTSSDYIVEDLYQVTEYIKSEYPNKKIILFGHSMGSLVARKYIKKYDDKIDKLIVCGSPSKNSLVSLALILTRIMSSIKSDRHRSKLINKLVFGRFNKNIENANSNNSWVCANEDHLNKYKDDELSGFIYTCNGFENSFRLMKSVYSEKGWELNNKDLPILFIAGSDDPVIINKDKWMQSQEFLINLGYKNVTNKLYNNMRHEILNEKDNKQVYKDILSFIQE